MGKGNKMTLIGHIQDIIELPPELIDTQDCELCNKNLATTIVQMNPQHAPDMYVCYICLELLVQINKMLEMMEC
jgi:hypothetical protein